MKTQDFAPITTSDKLAENLVKQFNTKVNLTNYGREQLEDIRNKLRTKIFQQEGSSKFNDLLTNETYQKDKAMLELLNTRIKEMLGEQMKQLRDKIDQLTEAKKSKPDFLDMDKDGNKKEPMKKAAADKKAGPKKGVNPFAKVKEGFPTVDSARADHEKNKTTGKFDKKETSTGTQYTRKSSTFTDGGDDSDVKAAKKKSKATSEAFPTADSARADHEKSKTTGKFDKKELKPGVTQYTRKASTFTDGGDDSDVKTAKKKAKSVKEGAKHAKDCDCNECMNTMEGLKGKQGKLDVDKDGKLEKSDFAALRAKKKVKESAQFKHNVRFVNESIGFLLNEDEEAKAKTITAAGDIVNDFTGWMQRIGQYQTKAIIELADSIRADFGAAESEAFKQKVSPALTASLETLTQQREILSNAVAELAGEAVPDSPMGMDPSAGMAADMDAGMDMSEPDLMNPEPEDEFGASDAAAGGDETAGRGMRESKSARRARKLAESHSILTKLAR
jgi:hypothetical protein